MKVLACLSRNCAVLMASLSAAVLLGCSGGTGKDTKPAAEKAGPPVAVSIADLTKEYKADATAADKKYKDKIVEFEGVLDQPPISGTLVRILLKDPSAKDSGMVRWVPVAAQKDKADALKTGQKVKVRGKAAGQSGIGDTTFVDVIDGEFIDIGPAPKQ